MSRDRGGTLAITIIGAAEAQRAATLLEEQGYGVSVAPVMEDSA